MRIAKKFYETFREIYGPILPTSKEKKEAFLENVRRKVEYYKPRIENKCKINLGEVKVKDNKYWLADVLYGSVRKRVIENESNQGKIPTAVDFHMGFMNASISEALLMGPLWIYNSVIGTDFRHYNNTIYAPFNYINRSMDIDFKERTKRLDYGVVHELSHTLWDKILGETSNHPKEGRKWFEGFATYCADEHFADFYPNGTWKAFDLPEVYSGGKKMVEQLISKHGDEILLEIPRRWEEFAGDCS